MKKDTLIFDMDGLLIDSERLMYQCFDKVMGRIAGKSMSKEFYCLLLGKTQGDIERLMTGEYGSVIDFGEFMTETLALLSDEFETNGVPVKDGAVTLLEHAKQNGYRTALGTSSYRNRVDRIMELAGLMKYFDATVCGDEVERGKPEPDIFLKACGLVGSDVSSAYVFEDSEFGITAAHRAGIDCICVPDLKYPDKEFLDMTFKVITRLDEALGIV